MLSIEDKIQEEIVKYFNNNYCLLHHEPRFLIFSIPNGGTRNKIEAMKLIGTGLLPGASDLILQLPYPEMYYIEVKTDKGNQSPEQKKFQERVTKLGYQYILVRSLKDFVDFLYSIDFFSRFEVPIKQI